MARPATPAKLRDYAAKRDFESTPEPPPKSGPAAGKSAKKNASTSSFCVQKHLATALHYDFRLEHDGVLLSWAVPKGPSLNPADKRMAVRTEDHPLAYGDFEGVIPGGYGAGVVMLWDRGTWQCELPDVAAALAKGELKFRLNGMKLKGSWVLVRTRRPVGGREGWLLIKHRDSWSGDVDVTTAAPDSVKTFGDLASIVAASKDAAAMTARAAGGGTGEAARLLRQVVHESAQRTAGGRPEPAAKTHQPARGRPKRAPRAKATPRTKPVPPSTPPTPTGTAGRVPKFTNATKVLFPATGFTKGDLIDYYRRVAPLILPHLRGRAVTLKRYPDGVHGKSFFEKRCASHRPEWVRTARVQLTDKAIDFCLIDDEATLLWAANLAAIELHVPLALAATPDTPTAMVFDLDPGPPAGLAEAARVALRLKGMLDELKLASFPKLSGGKGVHLLVPLEHGGRHVRRHEGVRQGRRVDAPAGRPQGRDRHHGPGGPGRQGVRRLGAERPEQNDGVRLLGAGAGAAERLGTGGVGGAVGQANRAAAGRGRLLDSVDALRPILTTLQSIPGLGG